MNTKVEGLFYLDGAPVSIEIADGKILQLTRLSFSELKHPLNDFIAPGFIDNQVNGYMNVDFFSPDITVEKIATATQALWKTGVTTYLPTIISAGQKILKKNLSILAQVIHQPELSISIPGFHLEGPYISPEDGFRGAHNKSWIRPPNREEFIELTKSAENKILQVTLAPEIDGAIDFIRYCKQEGIIVGLGHHNGSAEIIKQAIDAGASIATHLGNGCANMINRHNNPLWQQLADDRLLASLIVDGFHLRPEQVQVFFKVKGPERIIITSDMTFVAGMPPGKYRFYDQNVVLTPAGKLTLPGQNYLAGASFPITKGVENLLRFTQCSLTEAIHTVSKNPAGLYGLTDRGEILPGKRADLVLFTLKDNVVTIKKTILAGRVVYAAD